MKGKRRDRCSQGDHREVYPETKPSPPQPLSDRNGTLKHAMYSWTGKMALCLSLCLGRGLTPALGGGKQRACIWMSGCLSLAPKITVVQQERVFK